MVFPKNKKNTKKFANCNRGDDSLHDRSGWHRKLSEWNRWLECTLRNTRFGAWKFAYFLPNLAESKKRVVRVQWRVKVPAKKHAPVAQIIVIKGAGSATCACTHARTQVKSFIHKKKKHPSNHQLDNPIQRERELLSGWHKFRLKRLQGNSCIWTCTATSCLPTHTHTHFLNVLSSFLSLFHPSFAHALDLGHETRKH